MRKPKILESKEDRGRRYGVVLGVCVWMSLKGKVLVIPAAMAQRE